MAHLGPARVAGALALATLAGCGKPGAPKHQLEGSLSVLMDLSYDDAEVQLSSTELAVRFIRNNDGTENTPLRVGVSLEGTSYEAGHTMDLAETTPSGSQRGSVTRNVLDDPRRTFPALGRGKLTFHRSPVPGEQTSGDLSLTFSNGTELASGRTVFGTFEANVP